MLHDPVKVAVTPVATTAERIEQRIIRVDRPAKAEVLVDILRAETIDRALIFTRTKHGADKVARGLTRSGISAEAIHGNKSQISASAFSRLSAKAKSKRLSRPILLRAASMSTASAT